LKPASESDETFNLYLFDINANPIGLATGTIINDDSEGGKK
jgi:hypothetical protein